MSDLSRTSINSIIKMHLLELAAKLERINQEEYDDVEYTIALKKTGKTDKIYTNSLYD